MLCLFYEYDYSWFYFDILTILRFFNTEWLKPQENENSLNI